MNDAFDEKPVASDARSLKVWDILTHRWGWILVPTLVGLGIGILLYNTLPRTYKSRTMIQVLGQAVPKQLVPATVPNDAETVIGGLEGTIRSYDFLAEALRRAGAVGHSTPEEVVGTKVAQLNLNLELRQDLDMKVFEVTVGWPDPVMAAMLAREIGDHFMDANQDYRKKQAAENLGLLRKIHDEAKFKLEHVRNQLADFERSRTQFLPSREAQIQNSIDLRVQERSMLASRIAAIESRLSLMQQFPQEPQPVTAGQTAEVSMRGVRNCQAELSQLRVRFNEIHPAVRLKRQECEQLEQSLTGQASQLAESTGSPATGKTRDQVEAESELARLRAEDRQLQAQIGGLEGRLTRVPEVAAGREVLARAVMAAEQEYANATERLREAEEGTSLEENAQGLRFRVVQEATVPKFPSWPMLSMMLLGGIGGGLLLGIVFVTLAETVYRTFRFEEDLTQETGVPVLGDIPHLSRRMVRRHQFADGT
ncbi:MAG: hypothetical protein KBD01_03820 [Acidobacteria bacterium]|nr:hypothetical protein [Acidobacteriota bacterium]